VTPRAFGVLIVLMVVAQPALVRAQIIEPVEWRT
jgi:hypothetical protein